MVQGMNSTVVRAASNDPDGKRKTRLCIFPNPQIFNTVGHADCVLGTPNRSKTSVGKAGRADGCCALGGSGSSAPCHPGPSDLKF
ncbi:hypothetical protein BaRGS_00010547 [Batillaria attramentaria]|uniref:Uncharacterized protein n=1 Tax=Batillaria attramentaria TaxID=370345 RepID=A0ABD0LFP5_9CAEN